MKTKCTWMKVNKMDGIFGWTWSINELLDDNWK
jgi:hypothetical protein